MVMSRDQNAGQSHGIRTDNSFVEKVEQLKCVGTTLKDKSSIQEESKNKLKSGNVCYCSVQNLISSSFL
jgi:hypothetical protein